MTTRIEARHCPAGILLLSAEVDGGGRLTIIIDRNFAGQGPMALAVNAVRARHGRASSCSRRDRRVTETG